MAELIVVFYFVFFCFLRQDVGYYWYVVHICVSEPKNLFPCLFAGASWAFTHDRYGRR